MRTDHPIDASPPVSPSAPTTSARVLSTCSADIHVSSIACSPQVDAPAASRQPIPSLLPRPVAQQPDSAPQPSAPQPVAHTTASRSAAGQRSTAIRSAARRPHYSQSLTQPDSRSTAIRSAAGRSTSCSSTPTADHLPVLVRPRQPPQASAVASLRRHAHTRTPHSFALPRVTSTGGCRTGWFHPGSTTRNVRYPRSDGGYVWDHRACFSYQIWLGFIGTSVRPALRAFSLGPIERTHASRPQWV